MIFFSFELSWCLVFEYEQFHSARGCGSKLQESACGRINTKMSGEKETTAWDGYWERLEAVGSKQSMATCAFATCLGRKAEKMMRMTMEARTSSQRRK